MASSPTPSDISSTGLSPSRIEPPFRVRGSWSRSGCVTCKKRRKKCDEQKPKCGNCIKLGRDCEGYANLWITPMSTTTTTFQQQKVSKTKRRKISKVCHRDDTPQSPSSESYQTNSPSKKVYCASGPSTPESIFTVDALETHESEDTSRAMTLRTDHGRIFGNSINHSLPLFQPSELFYIQYHVERGSRLVSNLEMKRNPLNEVLIPRALSSPLLLNALCTLSAGHMSNWSSSNRDALRKAEMTYYGKTLSGIRNALTDLSQQVVMSPAYITLLEDLLATVASLCKYEAVRGSVRSWRGHLEALQSLVSSCGGLINLDREIADWLSGLLTYWQYMANLMNPNLRPRLTFCEGLYTIPKIDIYLGCSEPIVKVCSRIADLRRVDDFALLSQEVTEINEYLTNWSCREQSFIIPEGITGAALERLEMVANCFRYAAFIFLHSSLERLAWSATTTTVAKHTTWDKLLPEISHSKPQALQNIMALLHSHPPDTHTEFSALTFPLFIAGCECEGSEEHLSSILGALKTLDINFGIRNTRRAQELIELYWGSKPLRQSKHWLDLLEDMDWDLLLV